MQEGLPLNAANGIVHAADGYLWLSTYNGLARFDGHRFTVFNAANTPALPSNRFTNIHEGPHGDLWFATEQGDVIRYRKGIFTRFDERDGLSARASLWQPFYTDGDSLFIATTAGLARYHDGRISWYRKDLLNSGINAIQRDIHGNLWVAADEKGLFQFGLDGKVRQYSDRDGLPHTSVSDIFAAKDGVIWVGTSTGTVWIRDGRMEPLAKKGMPWDQPLKNFHEDASGAIYFSAGDLGWWRFQDGRITSFPGEEPGHAIARIMRGPGGLLWSAVYPPPMDPQQLWRPWLYRGTEPVFQTSSPIEAIAFDRLGDTWVATSGQGLFRLRPALFRSYGKEDGLPGENVYPVIEDRFGAIWAGLWGSGLVRLDSVKARRGEAGAPAGSAIIGSQHPSAKSIRTPDDHIMSIFEGRDGTIWVGSYGPLCRVRGSRCEPVELGVREGLNIEILAMHQDRRGRFWLGGRRGLLQGLPAGDDYTWSALTTETGLTHNWVRVITEARDGTLFFGTNGGGILRLTDEGTFDPLTTGGGLPSDNIRDIYEDADCVLWIATEDRGLCRLERLAGSALRQGRLTCLDAADGLYDDGLHRILEDDFGRMWMSTNRGIFWIRRSELNAFATGEIGSVTSVSYAEEDGMRNREGNGGVQPAGVKARDGRLWFPTQGGVVVVNPAEVTRRPAPTAVIDAARVNGNERPAGVELVLGPGKRDIEFSYATLLSLQPEDVRFQVRLEGYESDWRDAGRRRIASYTNLSPGRYRFLVRAGLDGAWGEAASLVLRREAYPWEMPWFYALGAILVLGLGYAAYSYRLRQVERQRLRLSRLVDERTEQLRQQNAQIEQQAEQLRRLSEAKSRLFENISHELRTPLTLTIGPLEDLIDGKYGMLASEARELVDVSLRNSRRQLRLINQLLDIAKLEAGAIRLHLRQADLSHLLRNIALAFTPLAERMRATFDVDVPSSATPVYFDWDQMEKVFTNLLSNAFKFTPEGGVIYLGLRAGDADWVEVIVRDSGPGILEEEQALIFDRFRQVEQAGYTGQGTGIGLALVKELVDLHGGKVRVDSRKGFGATFVVSLRAGPGSDLDQSDHDEAAAEFFDGHAGDGGGGLAGGKIPGSDDPDTSGADLPDPGNSANDDVTTVLVVDDNEEIRRYVRTHLEPRYRVVEAQDGRQGLDLARDLLPDLVLSDVMMPVMDGYALCRAIKKDPALEFIPIILLTARAGIDNRVEGLHEGVDDYLVKPFHAKELVARIDNLIALRHRLRDRLRSTRPAPLRPDRMEVVSAGEQFLEQVREVIENRMTESEFSVEELAAELGVSRASLYRRLGEMVDVAPNALILTMRLERAAQLLSARSGLVSEIAYAVGFKSVTHFSHRFADHFGISPSLYAEAGAS